MNQFSQTNTITKGQLVDYLTLAAFENIHVDAQFKQTHKLNPDIKRLIFKLESVIQGIAGNAELSYDTYNINTFLNHPNRVMIWKRSIS